MKIIKFLVITSIFLLVGCKNQEVPLGPTEFEKISPTEYLITKGDLSMEFSILALIENEIVTSRDKFSIYKDMKSYVSANDLIDLKAYSFGFTDVIEVTINENEKLYYEIFLNRENSDVFGLKYDFKNIEEEMKHLGELLEKYPPIIEKDRYDKEDYNILENEGIKSEDIDSRSLYKEYLVSIYLKTNILKHSNLNDRILKIIELDDSDERFGTIVNSSFTSYNDYAYFDSDLMFVPFKVNDCKNMFDFYNDRSDVIDNDTEIKYFHSQLNPFGYGCKYDNYSIDSLVFDLSSIDINSHGELDIEIKVGFDELKTVDRDNIILVDDYLYVYPIFTELTPHNNSGNYDSAITIYAKIYKGEELILDLHDQQRRSGNISS